MKKPHSQPSGMDFSPEKMEAALRKPATARVASAPSEPSAAVRQQLGVRISKDLYKRLKIKAVADEVLVQEIVERAVQELLDREDE